MIKNFLYLDQEKMYSLSSQMFEGVTAHVLTESTSTNEDSKTQKGPVGSGLVLAEAIRSNIRNTEKKFLHDYSYAIFEKELLEKDRVIDLCVEPSEKERLSELLKSRTFIKVKAKAIFNDVNKINELFSEFNSIGEAIALATNFPHLNALKEQLKEIKKTNTDRNQISQLESKIKSITNPSNLAKEQGLHQDQKFLDSLAKLTQFGFSDLFEIQQKIQDIIYTSCLKRDNLRETEDSLIKKYSRKTNKDIVIFGMITQGFESNIDEAKEEFEISNMKTGLMNMIESLSNIETSISGRQSNEIIIDPIAVYVEV